MLKGDFLNYFKVEDKQKVKEASKFLNIHSQTIYNWEDIVPFKWACVISTLTNGQVDFREQDYDRGQ